MVQEFSFLPKNIITSQGKGGAPPIAPKPRVFSNALAKAIPPAEDRLAKMGAVADNTKVVYTAYV